MPYMISTMYEHQCQVFMVALQLALLFYDKNWVAQGF